MTATIYGEARGELFNGKTAVGSVIRNRSEKGGWYGSGIKGVCLKPFQFSCFNHSDPNFGMCTKIATKFLSDPKLQEDKDVQDCLTAALLVLNGRVKDATQRSTHYHTDSISPAWAKGLKPVAHIGDHVFYNNVP